MKTYHKLFRSALFAQFPILIQLISGLVIMPRLILHFGDQNYGIWILLATFLGYFDQLDLGFMKALIRYVSRALGRNDQDEVDGWISVALLLFFLLTAVGFLLLVAGIWGCGYFFSEDAHLLRLVFGIGGASFLISFPLRNVAVGLLMAHVRGDIRDLIATVCSTLRIIVILIALSLNLEFLFFACVLAFFNLVQGGWVAIAAYKLNHGIRWRKDWINRENMRSFIDYSGFSFIAQLADLFRFQAYPVIISSFLGLSAITPFAIANRIRRILEQVYNKILVNFTPLFSQIEGRSGECEELRNTYFFAYKISCYLVLFLGGMVMIASPDFIQRWMGEDRLDSAVLLQVGLFGSISAGIQIPAVCLLFGTSRHRFYSISNSIEAVLIIVSAVLLVKPFGLIGMVAGASVATFLIKTFLQPMWVSRILSVSLAELHLRHTLLHLLRMIIFLVPVYACGRLWLNPNYMSIVLFGLCSCIVFVPFILFIGFTVQERRKLLKPLPIVGRWMPWVVR